MNTETNTETDTKINPIEDQREEALKHYEEASLAIHHWSSFVVAAIRAYNPDGHVDEKELMKKALERYCSPHGNPNPETYAYFNGLKEAFNINTELRQ